MHKALMYFGARLWLAECEAFHQFGYLSTNEVNFRGNAVLSPDETMLLVDNLTTGAFDIYQFPASTPSTTFSLSSTRRFTKQGLFAEDAKIAVCGSDHGRVQIVEVASGQCLQSLRSGQGKCGALY